jgi:N6-adenosine-specific RNA methylase IME4
LSKDAATKRERRAAKEAALAEATRAAEKRIGHQLYGVILADPPWRFEPYSRETGLDRSPENHYPTMATTDIQALVVPAAPNCVLFLWATVPMLVSALHVMNAWGFAYRSNMVWTKPRFGTGYWFRNQHELLLLGVRGKVPAPSPGDREASVLAAPLGAHSEKPEEVAAMIERFFPNLPKLEMFARRRRAGWDSWGNEV